MWTESRVTLRFLIGKTSKKRKRRFSGMKHAMNMRYPQSTQESKLVAPSRNRF